MGTVLHIITGLTDGGAEAVLFRLCTQDGMDHHEVVSLRGPGKYVPLLRARGISVSCLGMPRGRLTLSGLWQLWWLIRRVRPDAIQTWMYHADLVGGVIARLAGQRNIVWGIHHTTLIPGESSRSAILIARLSARLSGLVPRHIVCCAEKAREVHVKLGYDSSRIRVIPNGYDLSVFQLDAAAGRQVRKELALDETEPVIGFVARSDPQKDHETLLTALSVLKRQGKCPRCMLVGAGMDMENDALTGRVSRLGLEDSVFLLGCRNDIPAIMNALDVHVMSSAFGEAFPNVLAEAMACGTPCISTDVGDAPAIIGSTGWIIPPRDPEALAAAIADALQEQAGPNWNSRRDAARHHVAEHFSIERMVGSYRTVWFGNAC